MRKNFYRMKKLPRKKDKNAKKPANLWTIFLPRKYKLWTFSWFAPRRIDKTTSPGTPKLYKTNLEMLTWIDHQEPSWSLHVYFGAYIRTILFASTPLPATKHLQTSQGYGLGNHEQVFLSLHSDGGRGGEGKNFPLPTRTLYLPYMGCTIFVL